jgi:hypothetical protein
MRVSEVAVSLFSTKQQVQLQTGPDAGAVVNHRLAVFGGRLMPGVYVSVWDPAWSRCPALGPVAVGAVRAYAWAWAS